MKEYAVLAFVVVLFLLLLWLGQKPVDGKRRPVTLVAARFLRRLGRWFWALGEAVEIGFFRGRQVRDRISLDLDPSVTGGER